MRALAVPWIALWVWLTPQAVCADRLDDATRALARGDQRAALHALEPLARAERPRALALLGQVYALRGDRKQAEQAFYKLIDLYNDGSIRDDDGEGLWAVAEAAHGLGAFRDANDAFARAAKASPKNLEIELAWSDLFLEKYDVANAQEGLSRILAADPRHARALERMARVRLEQGAPFSEVEALLDKALESDPKLTAAHVSRAGLALRDEDLALADQHLDRALADNPRDLEALSVRAAVRFVADDREGMARAVRRTLEENPHFSRLYSIIATYAEWEHRYAELVELADAALKLDPEDAYAHATRGLNLLRLGREREGLEALTAAWSRDRYNVHVYNTLNLFDEVIAKEYQTVEAPPFRLRLHQGERKLLARYALPLLQRALADMTERYGYSPEGPLSIELFASEEHFSVRTSGLPHLGVQGVCFGKVLTALSPRGGEFNWGQILWHELSHVFHVQMSKSRVPRWFTEGLAEYETMRARPEWKREDDRALYDALEHGSLPSLARMNHAFTHARSADELMVAYYASSLAVAYVVERFGFPVVPRMLRLWSEGVPTDQVFARVLGQDLNALERDFRAQLQTRLGAKYARDLRIDLARYADLEALGARAARPDAGSRDRAAHALALAVSGAEKQALARADEVLRVDPKDPIALFTRVHVALSQGQLEAARSALAALVQAGHDGYQLRMLRARTEHKLGKDDQAQLELQRAMALDRERGEAYELSAELAAQSGDRAALTSALAQLSFLDQHARGPLQKLLPLLAEQADYPTLLQRAEAGLYLDPESAELHRLLALAQLHVKGPREALAEADQAVSLAEGEEQRKQAEATRAEIRAASKPGAAPAARPARGPAPRPATPTQQQAKPGVSR